MRGPPTAARGAEGAPLAPGSVRECRRWRAHFAGQGGEYLVDIELGLDGDRIGAQALHESLGELLDLLHDAAEVAGLDPQDWRVDGLRAASAHVSLAAPEGSAVVRELLNGVESLRRSSQIPARWSLRMVRKVHQLASHPGSSGTVAVTLTVPSYNDPVQLDSVVAAHAEEALSTEVVNLGSLRGRVDRWNEHSKRREIGLSREMMAAPSPSSMAALSANASSQRQLAAASRCGAR